MTLNSKKVKSDWSMLIDTNQDMHSFDIELFAYISGTRCVSGSRCNRFLDHIREENEFFPHNEARGEAWESFQRNPYGPNFFQRFNHEGRNGWIHTVQTMGWDIVNGVFVKIPQNRQRLRMFNTVLIKFHKKPTKNILELIQRRTLAFADKARTTPDTDSKNQHFFRISPELRILGFRLLNDKTVSTDTDLAITVQPQEPVAVAGNNPEPALMEDHQGFSWDNSRPTLRRAPAPPRLNNPDDDIDDETEDDRDTNSLISDSNPTGISNIEITIGAPDIFVAEPVAVPEQQPVITTTATSATTEQYYRLMDQLRNATITFR